MAIINNKKSNTLLSGTSGNDTIRNIWWDEYDSYGGSDVTINTGAGNDYIHTSGCDMKPLDKTVRQNARTSHSVD